MMLSASAAGAAQKELLPCNKFGQAIESGIQEYPRVENELNELTISPHLLMLSIVTQESDGKPKARRFEPHLFAKGIHKRPKARRLIQAQVARKEWPSVAQAESLFCSTLGLTAILPAMAYQCGYKGTMRKLFDPAVNVHNSFRILHSVQPELDRVCPDTDRFVSDAEETTYRENRFLWWLRCYNGYRCYEGYQRATDDETRICTHPRQFGNNFQYARSIQKLYKSYVNKCTAPEIVVPAEEPDLSIDAH